MKCYSCEGSFDALFPIELEIKKGIRITAYVCWKCHRAHRTKERV